MIPPLPPPPPGHQWSSNVFEAFQTLQDICPRAANILTQEAAQEHIQYYSAQVASTVIPILVALEVHAVNEDRTFPLDWVLGVTQAVGELMVRLTQAEASVRERHVISISFVTTS